MYGTCVIESVATKQGFWNIEKANSISSKPKWCEQVTCMHWLEQFFAFGFLIRFTHIKSEQEYSPTLFLVHVPCYAFGNVLAFSRRINKKIYRDFFRWHNILNKKMDKHFKNWKMFNNAKISSSFLKEMNFWLKIDWRYLWFHSLSNLRSSFIQF